MKKIIKKLFSRISFFVTIIILQIAFLVSMIMTLSEYFYFVYAGLIIIDIVMVIYITNQTENPSFKMSWIILISVFPLLGGISYLYIKMQWSRKLFVNLQNRSVNYGKNFLKQNPYLIENLEKEDKALSNLAKYVTNNAIYPIYSNTDVKYYSVGELQFEAMLVEMENAKKFIFMEYFIISEGYMLDKFTEVLKRKASEGVEVRLMYDGFGTQMNMPSSYFKDLSNNGIKCKVFNPFTPFLSSVQNHRDHRKILVIDGLTAFCGGTNIADEYINKIERFGHWKDTAIRLQGDAVWNFTVMFLQLWEMNEKNVSDYLEFIPKYNVKGVFHNDGYVQPFSDSPTDNEYVGEYVYLDIINNAKEYIYITTPYLIPDNEILTALKISAKKGVDVRIITPHIPDKWYAYLVAWNYYPELIEAGVKIFEYTPGFIHAKSVVSDDKVAVVGTINLDYRSLYLHFECASLMYKCSAILDIRDDFKETEKISHMVSLEDCQNRPIYKKIAGYILRIFAPLL